MPTSAASNLRMPDIFVTTVLSKITSSRLSSKFVPATNPVTVKKQKRKKLHVRIVSIRIVILLLYQ